MLAGLTDSPRWLPCRFLYDTRGSALFEEITRQPEYYLTRAEESILVRRAEEIRSLTGPAHVVELGSGSARKTGHLLDAYARRAERVRYVPIDVSESALRAAARNLERIDPARARRIEVRGVVGTYQSAFPLLRELSPCLVLFLGSTIGNFESGESVAFWRALAASLSPGDHFLLGVDLVKDRATLEAAYDDRAGVSVQFTRNLFTRMNRELGAGVDVERVEHVARYDQDLQRMEIFARFTADQVIDVAPLGARLKIRAGEMVLTEISRKFVLADVERHATAFGLDPVRSFTDDHQRFGLVLMRRTHESLEWSSPEGAGDHLGEENGR